MKWFQDSKGNDSSKRIFGAVIVITGVVMAYWGAIVSNPSLMDYSKWAIGFGTGLLAIGVVEKE